ncbi:MAG: 50S ribosomal protein L11 methyltransferase [Christensenellales bacterium]|jgi:ribosomal protein L11 methyltransferase
MNYTKVVVHTTTLGAEIVSGILDTVGVEGVIIEDRADICIYRHEESGWDYIDEHIADGMSPDVLVIGYLSEDACLNDRMAKLRERINQTRETNFGIDVGSLALETASVKEEDWANNWKKYYKPFPVGERLWVRPVWEQAACPAERTELVMDPGMAFGTGTHETTGMCLELLEKYVSKDMKIYDIGCGSGILAIASLKLGASVALAVDKDPVCIDATHNNLALNHMEDTGMTVRLGNLLDGIDEPADLIVSNIIDEVIISMAEAAKAHLPKGGVWIVSGITKERREDVEKALMDARMFLLDTRSRGEWVAMAWRK